MEVYLFLNGFKNNNILNKLLKIERDHYTSNY